MPIKASPAVAPVSDFPTPSQMKEFYTQVGRGDITKKGFQFFLRGELVKKSRQVQPQSTGQKSNSCTAEWLYDWCEGLVGEFSGELGNVLYPFFDPAVSMELAERPQNIYNSKSSGKAKLSEYMQLLTHALFWLPVMNLEFDSVTGTSKEGRKTSQAENSKSLVRIEEAIRQALAQQVQTREDLDPRFGTMDRGFSSLVGNHIDTKLKATGASYYGLISDGEKYRIVQSVELALRKAIAFYHVGDKERARLFLPFFVLQSSGNPVIHVSSETGSCTAYALCL